MALHIQCKQTFRLQQVFFLAPSMLAKVFASQKIMYIKHCIGFNCCSQLVLCIHRFYLTIVSTYLKLFLTSFVNLQDEEKRTALHAAAYCGESDCISILIAHGRIQSPNHYTKLQFYLIMKSHHSSIVKGLCSHLKVAHVPQKQTVLVINFYN